MDDSDSDNPGDDPAGRCEYNDEAEFPKRARLFAPVSPELAQLPHAHVQKAVGTAEFNVFGKPLANG
jgi:hypothetical protein